MRAVHLLACLAALGRVAALAPARRAARPVGKASRRHAEPDGSDAAPPAAPPADASAARMRKKLQSEAKYPLFVPLLGGAAILGGKGLTDALLTFAKVASGMKGATLTEEFLGAPVLAIDAACVVAGALIAKYAWDNQRPPESS